MSPLNRNEAQKDRLVELLDRIEKCPNRAAGGLVFGSMTAPRGIILTDHGRICWASAVGIPGRLRRFVHGDDTSLADSLERAKEVLRRYSVGDEALGQILVEHCSEAVQVLSELDIEPTWFDRSGTYDPKFTLAPPDVFAGLSRIENADLAATAERALERFKSEASGVAVVRRAVARNRAIIAAVDGRGIGVARLEQLAQWGESALVAANSLCSTRVAAYESKRYGATCVWASGNIICIAWAPDGRVLAPVLANPRAL